MTVVAVVAARNMRRVLASCIRAVVAGAATSKYLRVIDSRNGRKYSRIMAVFTDICRLHVRGILADCLRAVVTTDTVTGDIHVIEKHR